MRAEIDLAHAIRGATKPYCAAGRFIADADAKRLAAFLRRQADKIDSMPRQWGDEHRAYLRKLDPHMADVMGL